MRTLKNISPAILSTAALGISSAINFVGVMVWVRILTPGQFGIYALLSSSALFLNAIAFEWIRTMTARLLYDGKSTFLIDRTKSFLLLLITVSIAAVLLAVALAAFLSGLDVAGIPAALFPIVAVYAVSEMAIGMINAVSRVRMLHWQFFASMVLRAVLVIVTGYVFVVELHLGAEGLALGTAMAQLLAVVLICAVDPIWRRFRVGAMLGSYRQVNLREIWGFGAPLIVSNGLTYLVSIIDRYLIAALLGSMWVGFYVAPLDLTTKTIGILMLALNIMFYPSVVRAYEDHGRLVAAKRLEENFALQLLVLSIPVVLLTGFPDQVCRIVLGHNFSAESGSILPWLTAAVAIRVLIANFLMIIFQLEKKTIGVAVAPAISLAAVVPLGLYGMSIDGIRGMAIAAALAQAITWIVCLVAAKRVMPVKVMSRDAARILMIDAALLIVAFVLPRPTTVVHLIAYAAGLSIAFAAAAFLCRLKALDPIATRLIPSRRVS